MCWKEFRRDQAEWQGETWTNAEWRLAQTDVHPLFGLSGVGILNVFPDWMHTKHLGTDKTTYASALHILVYEIMPGSPEDNLDEIWSRCLTYYREHKIVDRYRNMKLGLFCKPSTPYSGFPKLRGKAVEVRNLGPPLSKIWGELMNPALPLHLQVAFLLKSSVKLEKMLRDNKALFRYPAALSAEFLAEANKYLQLSSSVARSYNEAGRRLFDITTKHHILWHAAASAQLLNPAKSWCYMGEDCMQHARRLAASSLRGTKPQRVGGKVLDKWARGFSFRFVPRKRWFRSKGASSRV